MSASAGPPVTAHTPGDARQVTEDSLALHAVARRLRVRRFAGGALRLDNTRLYFTLDAGGQPVAAAPYVQQARAADTPPPLLRPAPLASACACCRPARAGARAGSFTPPAHHAPTPPPKQKHAQEANQLVEEFMLLANQRVAGIISGAFPEHAVLRCAAEISDCGS